MHLVLFLMRLFAPDFIPKAFRLAPD